jgi:protein-disulfide isomerase
LPETDRPIKKDEDGRGVGRAWPLLVGLPLILAVAVAAVIFSGGGERPGLAEQEQPPQPAEEEQPSGSGREEASRGGAELGHPARGSADAPVVMVEYGDFQCPFCGKFAREVEPKLVEKYVEDGTLRMEWRDFPYLGQESLDAALAARAAQDQGKFWEYHDLLYENQSGGFSDEKLIELAPEAGLDVEEFESSFKSGEYEALVKEAFLGGQRRGVSGTPTFVINGKVLAGAQPVEVFEDAIERAKREAGRGD